MSALGTMWRIARREVTERGRSKAYLITSTLTLLLVVGLVVVPQMLGGGPEEYRVGTIGEGNQAIVDATVVLGNANDEPGADPSIEITTEVFDDREEAIAAVDSGDLDAALVEGREVIVESAGGFFGGSALLPLMQQAAASIELEQIVAEAGETATDVIQVMTSDSLEITALSGEEADAQAAVAYAGLLLLYMAVLLYGTWVLSGVTEEKSNRVVEVLISSIRPWQLLAGKILGIGVLGIAQFAGTIVVVLVTVEVTGVLELPSLNVLTAVNLVVWFVLGFLLFAVLFGAAGSLVSRMEDAQSAALPMTLVGVAGFFVSIGALGDPDGLAAVIGTFVPLTAPFVVPVRSALDAIPWWHYGAAVVLTIATIIGLVFVAGRIYAGGLLRYGGRVKVREAWRSANE